MAYTYDTIVAYDISDNRRRTKISNRLMDFGLERIQYSIFWGKLLQSELRSTKRFLDEYVKEEEGEKVFILTGQFAKQLQSESIGYSGKTWENETYVDI